MDPLGTAVQHHDESAFVTSLPALCPVLTPPARSCRHCNVAGFCAGALGRRAELRRLRFFWIALPTAKTSVSSILALLASLGLILLATIIVFKLLLKNGCRARRV